MIITYAEGFVMDYPIDTEYKGFIVRQHDTQYQKNTFQGCYLNGQSFTQFSETWEEIERAIDRMIRQYELSRNSGFHKSV